MRRIVGDTRASSPTKGTKGTKRVAAFHPVTADWFARRFDGPSPAQKQAWPRILAFESTLISAPTGSGKTLAAFLCAIDRLVFEAAGLIPSGPGFRL